MENKYYVYIIRSDELNKFYVGSTHDLSYRLSRHGKDRNKYTGRSNDWKLIKFFEVSTKSDALKFEIKIKKRGIKRFLDDIEKIQK